MVGDPHQDIQLRRTFLVGLLLIPAVGSAQQLEDHPLLTRYAGSTVLDKKQEEFGQYRLVTGLSPQHELQGPIARGEGDELRVPEPRGTVHPRDLPQL